MSRPLLATSVASRIERAFALNLFREPKRLFWKRGGQKGNERIMLTLVNELLLKYWYKRTEGETTQRNLTSVISF